MYTRSYPNDTHEKIIPPENYDGIAFGSEESEGAPGEIALATSSEPRRNPWEEAPPPKPPEKPPEREDGSIFTSLTKSPVFGSIFKNTPLLSSLKMPKIGLEELLIIGAAAYLFFSKDGDRECALILLLLLLIN